MNEYDSAPAAKKNSSLYAVIIILALAVAGLIIWQFSMRSNLKALVKEKEQARVDLQKDLDSLMEEHEQVKQLYGTLSDSLMVKDSVIQANAVEIKRLLDTEWEYYKVKKKLGQLQLIAQGYVYQMDSLYRVNATLTEENQTMRQDLKVLKKEKEVIEKDKQDLTEKVGIASVLRAYNTKATGVRFKSGGDKEVETDKVQKVDQVKVCFTIAENEIAVPGRKQVYVRIARPDKEILTKGKLDEYTFEFEGKKIQYSMMETIEYENDAIDLCLYWRKSYSSQELPPGLYHVDIFCEGSEIGNTTFTLR
jgi:hypothetical protein